MAVTKTIGQLDVVTSAVGDDLIEVEVAATGVSRRITKANFIGATLTGGGSIVTGGHTFTIPGTGTAALRTGTPTAGKAASWSDANTLQDAGILIADIYQKTDIYLVDKNFTNNASAKRYNTISAAMSAATVGSTILVGPGTYTEDITFSQPNITLVGAGTPFYDGTNLQGGTIVIGLIDCDGKRGAVIKDLGVDIRTTGHVDAISSDDSAVGSTAIYQEFHNLICIGKGNSAPDRGHGILCSTGGGNVIRNCKFYTWYHGIALRCSNSIVSDCYFYNCLSDSIIVKSDTGSGNAWNNTITNCILDGSTASGFTRGGPIRIQSIHASFSTRFTTVSNISAKNCGEGAVLIQQVAGTCANTMVSNVISYSNGDAASRADFDVDTATDVHFVNCMSANRSAGYGFRNASGSRIRALNCSSDGRGAGRYIGTFDYLDLGSGQGSDLARVENLVFDDQLNALALRRAAIVCGNMTAASGVATDLLTCLWTGNGNSTSLSIDLLITIQSGTLAKLYHYQVVVERANSTTLDATIEAIGTAGLTTAGSGNSLTVTVDVATANTAIIKAAGSGGAVPVSYIATVVSLTVSAWTITAA